MSDLSLAKVASAMQTITERFAHEVFTPEAAAPSWSDFQWRIATAVASMQGVSSLLRTSLPWTGPPSWESFLCEQRDHVEGRYRRIRSLLDAIDFEATQKGLGTVALKGAALLARGIYQGHERPMADIDLLVHHPDVTQMTRLLEGQGFELTSRTWRHQTFESRGRKSPHASLGEHVDNPIKIELHTKIQERLPVRGVEITDFVWPAKPRPGLNGYASTASLMMHLLLHAAGNMRAHTSRLIQLCDIGRLAGRLTCDDWDELLRARPSGQAPWWAMPPLALTEHYFPGSVAPGVIKQLARQCPWLLRRLCRRQRLTQVSWSNIRAHAFPGIQWCRTPTEAARFMIGRVRHSRQSLTELKQFASHDSRSPQVASSGRSRGARILRWAFSRPPRVQLLLPVRAALSRDTPGCTPNAK